MKYLLKFTFIFIICSSFNFASDKVYVCDSKSSVAYHQLKDCRGLKKCKHEIIYINKTDAVNIYGKRACKICY